LTERIFSNILINNQAFVSMNTGLVVQRFSSNNYSKEIASGKVSFVMKMQSRANLKNYSLKFETDNID